MHYTFSAERPNSRYIDIEFTTSNPDGGEVLLQLPSWRPGRYELGNFARNIQRDFMSSMRLENRFLLKTNERFVAGTRQRRGIPDGAL